MRKILIELVKQGLTELGVQPIDAQGVRSVLNVQFDFPQNPAMGHMASNVALMYAKQVNKKPIELALELVEFLTTHQPPEVAKIEIAGPGFINFFFTPQYFASKVAAIRQAGAAYGASTSGQGKKVMVEYTDPNPFKIFHIGHLMSNTIGESIARLIAKTGAEVQRVNYQGDVGRHVALTIWGMRFMDQAFPTEDVPLVDRIEYLGKAYATGAQKFYADETANAEVVQEINKRIYERTDSEINELYDKGREWSLAYFETLYDKLGTKFNHYFFESQVADHGVRIVREFLAKGIFEESDGAVVFKGENFNPSLHTRVFINSQGLPTYETKELGLAHAKQEVYDADLSIVITANEQREYFKVLLEALKQVNPVLGTKTKHIDHGMLKLPSGKMSSRKGEVVSAESLISTIQDAVNERLAERNLDDETRVKSAERIAIAALKYTILKQSPGKDIIFDLAQSISFEGDSGPYLQYTFARSKSILEKAKEQGIAPAENAEHTSQKGIEQLLMSYPYIVERAALELSPQLVTVHLVQLASAFNSWYADGLIVDTKDPLSPAKIALTDAVMQTLASGLDVLGMKVPEKM